MENKYIDKILNIAKYIGAIVVIFSFMFGIFKIYDKIMTIDDKIDNKFKIQNDLFTERFNSFECKSNYVAEQQNIRIQNIENTLIENTILAENLNKSMKNDFHTIEITSNKLAFVKKTIKLDTIKSDSIEETKKENDK